MNLTAWDRMCVSKQFPGEHTTPYVAGMNTLSLPTSCFTSQLVINSANTYGDDSDNPLGHAPYLLLMWCPAMTAIYGTGKPSQVPSNEKLGGLVVK